MTLYQRDRENIEQGREEGREEGRVEGREEIVKIAVKIIKMYDKGQTGSDIAEVLNLDQEYVKKIITIYEKI